MLILYCDFYIVNDSLIDLEKASIKSKRFETEYRVRSVLGAYKFQKKIDICKYMIDSYSVIEWDGVCVRYECEDRSQEKDFGDYIRAKFPSAEVFNKRSDSAYKYIKHIELIKEKYGNPWVFFAPNNDHIFISSNNNLSQYVKYLENFELKYKSHIISLFYSHYSEMMNIQDSNKLLWGDNLLFPQLVYEDEVILALKMNRFCCDSIQVYRLDVILNIFKETKKTGKIIRLENTEFFLSTKVQSIVVVPKKELFRHYDGYYHRDCWVGHSTAPYPLFIPDGFFENNIKIRFGYEESSVGAVNINPNEQILSYQSINKPDLNHSLDHLPYFWRSKIKDISVNKDFLYISTFNYNHVLINPFKSINIFKIKIYQCYFICRSIKNLLINKIRYNLAVKLRNKRLIWKLKRLKKLF